MTKSLHRRKKETKPRHFKNKDGNYVINGKSFRNLFGSREDVLGGVAYKTKGELTKKDLAISKNVNHKGKLVSRKKLAQNLVRSNLKQHNQEKQKRIAAAKLQTKRKK